MTAEAVEALRDCFDCTDCEGSLEAEDTLDALVKKFTVYIDYTSAGKQGVPLQQALDHEDHCGYYEAETAGLQGGQHRRIEGAAEEGQESDSTE